MIIPNTKTRLQLCKFFVCIDGILLILFIFKTILLLTHSETTNGIVINLIDDNGSYRPLIEFVDQFNKRQEFTAVVASDPPAYSVGEQVEIIYSTTNPANARINKILNIWIYPLIFGIAMVCLLFGVIWYSRKMRKLKLAE